MIINIVCNDTGVCDFEDKKLLTESFKVTDFFAFLTALRRTCVSSILDGAITRQEVKFVTVSTTYLNCEKPKVTTTGLDPYNWTLPSSVVSRLFCLADEGAVDLSQVALPADQLFRNCLQSLNYEK